MTEELALEKISGRAAQFKSTQDLDDRIEVMNARAIISLPEPLSPVIRIVALVAATFSTRPGVFA